MLQAAILKEREATQALLAAKDKEMKEMEERMAALLEAERARNNASNTAMYELFVVSFFFIFVKSCILMFVSLITKKFDLSKRNVQSMCEKTGHVPPAMPDINMAGTVSFISMQ